MSDTPSQYSSGNIQNVMTYGTPSAKAEIIIKLIYIGNVEVLQKVYDALTDRELNRIVGFA